jgi:hypothetical protein
LARALIALHYQNDICHPDGKIPFAIDRTASTTSRFLGASKSALGRARQLGFMIAHVHIAFSPDYADLPRHGTLRRLRAASGRDFPHPQGQQRLLRDRAASDLGSQRRDRSDGLWACNTIFGRAHSPGRGGPRLSGHGPPGLLRVGQRGGRDGRVRSHVDAGGGGGIDELALEGGKARGCPTRRERFCSPCPGRGCGARRRVNLMIGVTE